MNLLEFYFIITIVSMIIFTATAIVLIKKYLRRGVKLHFWAAVAFIFLTFQELIVAYWLIETKTKAISFYTHPWHLQVLLVFFAFTLLGLSITGKIKD